MTHDECAAALKSVSGDAQACQNTSGLWASLTLAQWADESGFGQHAPGFNAFGIKAPTWATGDNVQLLWTHEVIDGESTRVQARFRKYPNQLAAFEDHARLLTQGHPYAAVWAAHKADVSPMQFISAFAHIYATDPIYATKLENLIGTFQLLQYDQQTAPVSVPVPTTLSS